MQHRLHRPYAAILKHIAQSHAGPFGAADSAGRPLIAARRRIEFGATVAAAFYLQLECVLREIVAADRRAYRSFH